MDDAPDTTDATASQKRRIKLLLSSPGLHEHGHDHCHQNKNNDDGQCFKGPHSADLRQARSLMLIHQKDGPVRQIASEAASFSINGPERAGVTAPHRPNPCERLDNVAAAELLFAG